MARSSASGRPAFPIGSAVAPTAVAIILQIADWRWAFFATAIIAGAVLAVTAFTSASPRQAETGDGVDGGLPDIVGTVLGTAAVALLTLGVTQAPDWGWVDPRTLTALGSAAILLPTFVRRSLRHDRPLLDLSLFRIRTFATATLANVFISTAGMAVWLLWPLVLTNEWGYSRVLVGLAITPTPMLAGSISMLATRHVSRNGYRTMLIVGSLVLVVSCLWFVFTLDTEPNYLGAMLPGIALFGIGMGFTFAPVNAAALIDIPPDRIGQANAGFTTCRFIAGALGIAVTIAALESTDDIIAGYDRAFVVLAIASLCAAALVAATWDRDRVS